MHGFPRPILPALLVLALVPAVGAQDSPPAEEPKVGSPGASQAPAEGDRLAELERRIDLLAAELEKTRTGGAAETESGAGAHGLAPAASKVYRTARGVSIGGYGEVLYENYQAKKQDGTPSGRTDQTDFLRGIVYVGYKFSDRILFNSELEFEHASTGKGGEVSVEFGYLEMKPWKGLGFRAGMLLVPVGFLNELHEPPVFHGARRPDVESAIVPSTWRENGAGLFGEAGPVSFRAYLVSGLSSSGFSAAGIRGGRQSGARSKSEDFAVTGRVDWSGPRGLLLGVSFFSGGSGQGATVGETEIGGRVTLLESHLQYQWRGLEIRALGARSSLADAALINAKNSLAGAKSVGEAQYGYYLQAAYDLMSLRPSGQWSVTPFVRYEKLDTQDGVPAGFQKDPASTRTLVTAGLGVRPLPQVVLKADYQRMRNQARTGVSQFNLAVGYLF